MPVGQVFASALNTERSPDLGRLQDLLHLRKRTEAVLKPTKPCRPVVLLLSHRDHGVRSAFPEQVTARFGSRDGDIQVQGGRVCHEHCIRLMCRGLQVIFNGNPASSSLRLVSRRQRISSVRAG
jgi:hypothetical protein